MTDKHCSYCDATNLDETIRRPPIDHFRPKSRPEFFHLAFEWTNLYVCCDHCNSFKADQWEVELLAPDAPDYDFSRYFFFDPRTGLVEPNPAASPSERRRAEATIRILGFNQPEKPGARRMWFRLRKHLGEKDDVPYRFIADELP